MTQRKEMHNKDKRIVIFCISNLSCLAQARELTGLLLLVAAQVFSHPEEWIKTEIDSRAGLHLAETDQVPRTIRIKVLECKDTSYSSALIEKWTAMCRSYGVHTAHIKTQIIDKPPTVFLQPTRLLLRPRQPQPA